MYNPNDILSLASYNSDYQNSELCDPDDMPFSSIKRISLNDIDDPLLLRGNI